MSQPIITPTLRVVDLRHWPGNEYLEQEIYVRCIMLPVGRDEPPTFTSAV